MTKEELWDKEWDALIKWNRRDNYNGAGGKGGVKKEVKPVGNKASLGVTGAVQFDVVSGESVLFFGGGPRITPTDPMRFRPYGEVLIGFERSFGETAFAIQPGGGITIPYRDTLALRASFDFRTAFYEGVSSTGFSFGFGVVVPWGAQ